MHTVQQVATILGVDDSYVRRLCGRGTIAATRYGRDWLISDEALQAEIERRKTLLDGTTAGETRQGHRLRRRTA